MSFTGIDWFSQTGWPVCSGNLSVCLPLKITGACYYLWLFTWMLRVGLRPSCLPGKLFTHRVKPPAPRCCSFEQCSHMCWFSCKVSVIFAIKAGDIPVFAHVTLQSRKRVRLPGMFMVWFIFILVINFCPNSKADVNGMWTLNSVYILRKECKTFCSLTQPFSSLLEDTCV